MQPTAIPPANDRKPLWAAVGILSVTVIVLAATLAARVIVPATAPTTETGPVATTPEKEPARGPLAQVGREPFGPLVSPDGAWLLVEESSSEPVYGGANDGGAALTHTLIARSLTGLGERSLLTVREERDATYGPVSEKRFTSSWTPAGWSADGKTAYYVTNDLKEGLGGYYPSYVPGGERLYAVDVASGKETPLLESAGAGVAGGIRDVYGPGGLVLQERVKSEGVLELLVSRLEGSGAQTLVTATDHTGYASAVFDPSGTRVAVVSYSLPGETYVYRLQVIELATGKVKDVKAPTDREWIFRHWSGPDAVRVTTYGQPWEEIEIDVP